MVGVAAAAQVLRRTRILSGQAILFLLMRRATTSGNSCAVLGIVFLYFAGLNRASNGVDARR